MLSINADTPVLCRVVENRSADVAHFALRIEAPRGTVGQYSLVVRKSDLTGTATMQQGGVFNLSVRDTGEVGNVIISVRPDGHLTVDGSVQVKGRNISCAYISTQDL